MGWFKGWLGWGTLALLAAGSSSCGGDDQSAELRALRERIEAMEAAQEQDRELIARTLEASTGQLALVLAALRRERLGDPGEGPPTQTEPPNLDTELTPPPTDPGDSRESQPDPNLDTTGEDEAGAVQPTFEFDFEQAAVIFLAVSVFLLIAVVVFFPARMRGPVPAVEYSAREPEALPSNPIPSTPDVVMSPGTSENGDKPVRHRLALPAGEPGALRSLVEALETYLSTEPHILRHPEPRVALLKGELHLQFFALPSLSESEHALLDDTVRRLHSADSGDSEDAPAA